MRTTSSTQTFISLTFALTPDLLFCLEQDDIKKVVKIEDFTEINKKININDFEIPEDFNLEAVISAITTGPGWFRLRKMYSQEDIEAARKIIYHHNKADKVYKARRSSTEHITRDEQHNKYNGLVWALFNKGRVFEKMAQHPVILNISNVMLGESSMISSLAANTVLPGQGGQLPHLDYPYYRTFYPSSNPNIMDTAPPLSVQFVTLITDFSKENGATAIRPHSHKQPKYPDDVEDFYANSLQMEGNAGDVVVFAGAMQHCAMPNNSTGLRSGVLQHMVPVYIKPFEAMSEYVRADIKERASPAMRRVLALDHPYPVLKH